MKITKRAFIEIMEKGRVLCFEMALNQRSIEDLHPLVSDCNIYLDTFWDFFSAKYNGYTGKLNLLNANRHGDITELTIDTKAPKKQEYHLMAVNNDIVIEIISVYKGNALPSYMYYLVKHH